MKMVERMARAICREKYGEEHFLHFWEQYSSEFIVYALAALRAMREPNREMVDAAWDAVGEGYDTMGAAITAAIDAAIKEAEGN